MGLTWVKARSIVRLTDEHGRQITYHPGDWLQVKGMIMNQLLARKQIEIPGRRPGTTTTIGLFDLDDCGVVITGGPFDRAKALLHESFAGMAVTEGFDLTHGRTLLWNAISPLRLDMMAVGFHRLTAGWQVVAPIWKYQRLARDIGTDEDRQRTAEIIRDLRVPVYDTHCVYVRRCGDTERLMRAWKQERNGGDDKLAFHRALYRVKPVICPQPITWMNGVKV